MPTFCFWAPGRRGVPRAVRGAKRSDVTSEDQPGIADGPGQDATRLERLRAIAERVARSRGLEVFDVQYRRESPGWVLRVILDKVPEPGGTPEGDAAVTVEDCQRVSEELSAILDVEDPIEHAYTLEISSPGLDRPLRGAADYGRFSGRLAKIVLTEPVDGRMHYRGRLQGVEGSDVLLTTEEGRAVRIPFSAIARGRLEVEF